MIVLKILSLIIWLVFIPFCMGFLPGNFIPEKERTPGVVFLLGYTVMFALFELVGIPVVIAVVYHGFSLLSRIFMALSLLAALAGVAVMGFQYRRGARPGSRDCGRFREMSLEEAAGYLIFAVIVGFQLYMAFTRASFDGDDAYYGVQGLTAWQHDTLYRINPNNGRSAPLDVRHGMALLPIWEAFVGKMSGIHVAVIAHSVVPLVLLPLTYLVYFQIGKKLFAGKEEARPVFMILMALFQMFGNVSIYTNETFLLTRTWQGKSVAGNFIIPMVFWVFLCLFEEAEKDRWKRRQKECGGYWAFLACLNLAAGVSSSLAVLLCSILTAGLGFLFAIRKRSFGVLIRAGLACIPGAAYVLTYIIISH